MIIEYTNQRLKVNKGQIIKIVFRYRVVFNGNKDFPAFDHPKGAIALEYLCEYYLAFWLMLR